MQCGKNSSSLHFVFTPYGNSAKGNVCIFCIAVVVVCAHYLNFPLTQFYPYYFIGVNFTKYQQRQQQKSYSFSNILPLFQGEWKEKLQKCSYILPYYSVCVCVCMVSMNTIFFICIIDLTSSYHQHRPRRRHHHHHKFFLNSGIYTHICKCANIQYSLYGINCCLLAYVCVHICGFQCGNYSKVEHE